ncbi:MAG: ABC transporter substrate-binding protein [Acidobacteriota bacterium]|nr:ABC transporter substrate-binding protein [Acidobacteriota bacterium]
MKWCKDRSVAPFSTTALLVLAALGCRSDHPAGAARGEGGEPQQGGTAIIGASIDPGGLNPLLSETKFAREVHDLLFLRLLDEQADYSDHPPTFEPELAESHTWAEDGRSVEMRLRQDVVWSDGTPVTAEDVVWTHEAQIDPDVAWNWSQQKDGIERIEAQGPFTVVFHLREPHSASLADLNEGVILPKHVWGRLPFSEWRSQGDWFRENLVVDGPFRVADWRAGREIVLERNTDYYRQGFPRLDSVVFRFIPEKANQLEQLLSAQLDYAQSLRPEWVDRVVESERVRLIAYPTRHYAYIVWNGCKEPFSDPRLRRALTVAIDRESITEALYSDYATVAASPILSSVWAFNRDIEPLPYDATEARRILESLGWTDSDGDGVRDRNGERLSFKLSTNSDNRIRVDAITMAKTQLAQVGVEAELDLMEFGTLIDRNNDHDFDASLSAWAIDTSLDLRPIFHIESIGNGSNYGCYSNPEVDDLLDQARRARDPETLKRLLAGVQQRIHEEQPYTFLWEPMQIDGVANRLRDPSPNALSVFANLEEWWISPGSATR